MQADAPPLSQIELPKVIDLIVSKQTQYYTLWAVYTAVQFAAGSYGSSSPPSLMVGLAVLFGVWAFNLGHLGFVLQCVSQLNKLGAVLDAALTKDHAKYQASLNAALIDMKEVAVFFWRVFGRREGGTSYALNMFVHFFIDICASVALLLRIKPMGTELCSKRSELVVSLTGALFEWGG